MLAVAEELAQGLSQQPVEVAVPVEALGLHGQREPLVGEERLAGPGALLVCSIHRDDDVEVGEGLRLQRAEARSHLVRAAEDRNADRDRAGHASALPAGREDPVSAPNGVQGAIVSLPGSTEW